MPAPDSTAHYPDRTRHAWDVLQLHRAAVPIDEIGGWWVAIRMSDGKSDGNLYRSKPEAVRFQLHENQCAYLCVPPFGEMPIGELHGWLAVVEKIYEGGGRLSDVDTHVVQTDMPIRRPI
jgi:hypothetical protein